MSQVGTHGASDDGRLGLQPANAVGEAVELQPQERPQRQADVVALRRRRPRLAALHLGTLLDPPVVVLDRPAVLPVLEPGQVGHAQVAGRPVRDVAVWGDYLEYLDQPVALEPNLCPGRGDLGTGKGPNPLT